MPRPHYWGSQRRTHALQQHLQIIKVIIAKEEFAIDLYTIPLGGFDLVLGCDWLSTLGPIIWDLGRLSMTFWHNNHLVKWHGIGVAPGHQLVATTLVNYMQLLLMEFADLFLAPKGLPPQRPFDHRIHLLPGTEPVAVRPYRYA